MPDGDAQSFDLSGIAIRLTGVPRDVGGRLAEGWRPFVVRSTAAAFLEVEVLESDAAPHAGTSLAAVLVREAPPCFAMPEGRAELHPGRVRIELRPGPAPSRQFALINLLLASLAWRLPDRRALLLHAAGLVVDGRAFALVGPAGSGKSTWAALGRTAGALPISEDLICIEAIDAGIEVLSLPFRADARHPIGPRRWPLAALLFPEHAAAPALSSLGTALARARIVANLPHLSASRRTDDTLTAMLERVLTVPLRRLAFSLDPGFVPLLRAFPRS